MGLRGTDAARNLRTALFRNGGLRVDDLRNFIGGQYTDISFDRRAELIDPSTGEVFATAPVSSETEVDAAFSSAAEAFEGWRDATPAERSLARG